MKGKTATAKKRSRKSNETSKENKPSLKNTGVTTTSADSTMKRSKGNDHDIAVGEETIVDDSHDTADNVSELLAFLEDHSPISDEKAGSTSSTLTSTTWKKALENHFASDSFATLARFVATERKPSSRHVIYPPPEATWAALNACPLHAVKVVIVGQDPYHGPGQAHGLCFSVPPNEAVLPPSLKSMYELLYGIYILCKKRHTAFVAAYKELADDPNVDFALDDEGKQPLANQHGHLLHWAQQGVLLLNSVLTVRRGQAHSHKRRGWEETTDAILRAVMDRNNNQHNHQKPCVFLLWGKPATEKALQLMNRSTETMSMTMDESTSTSSIVSKNGQTVVICTSHPSPLGARKTKAPFLGSRCFSRCNEALIQFGQTPIDWNVGSAERGGRDK